jgi:uncharacterized protein YndB with AHSA1/START domain
MTDQKTHIPMKTPDPQGLSNKHPFIGFCLKVTAGVFIMGLGAAYGVTLYKLFAGRSIGGEPGGSGLMLLSFLVGMPLALGAAVGFLAYRKRLNGLVSVIAMPTLAMALFVFVAGAFLGEGVICIIMILPIFWLLAVIGGLIGLLVSELGKTKGPKLLSVTLILPLMMGYVEEDLPTGTQTQLTTQSIYIAASPEVIWQHLNFPLNIQPAELSRGWAYAIGVPYPIEGRTIEGRVGGTRVLRWQRGVQFEEVITDWQPNQHIAWTYKFSPSSFPADSLDNHIVIGGRYFKLLTTDYTLKPEGQGTRLFVNVESTVTTPFNAYAGWCAKFLIADTAQTILGFYKSRAENELRQAPRGG